MDILITGANGMLGGKCVELLSKKHNVIASDIGDNSVNPQPVTYKKVNIADKKSVFKAVNEVRPDVVLNCGAYTDVDGAEINRQNSWDVNVEGVKNIINAMVPFEGHLIQISTDYVFDGSEGPYKEEDDTSPINYYGETKLAAEEFITGSGAKHTIIRTNVLYGVSLSHAACFVNWVIGKMKNREVIYVVNDQFGNPTWVVGLAEAISLIIDKEATGVFHYGGLDYLNRFEFALQIAAIFALDPRLIRQSSTRALGQRAKRPYKAGLYTDKITKELGAKVYSIKESLEIMKGSIIEESGNNSNI